VLVSLPCPTIFVVGPPFETAMCHAMARYPLGGSMMNSIVTSVVIVRKKTDCRGSGLSTCGFRRTSQLARLDIVYF